MLEETPLRKDGSWLILSPQRDIVSDFIPQLKHELNTALAGGEFDLALDLQKVAFIDSVGLALLLSYHKQQQIQKRRMVLTNLSEEVQRILASTRLNLRLEIVADVTDIR